MTATTTTLGYKVREFLPELFTRPRTDLITNQYTKLPQRKGFAEHYERLRVIETERSMWPEDAEPPSSSAVYLAWMVINQLYKDEIIPTRVVASAEGGVAICFVVGEKYADIECLNKGAILGVISNRHDPPMAWEIEQNPSEIARASFRVWQFLEGDLRPKRMLQRGRGVDSNFKDCHQLYHRCKQEDVAGDRLLAARISYKKTSVNWSKYSKPWDVIFDYPGWGIARFFVGNLPKELPKELPKDKKARSKVKVHSFIPVHVPELTNYAHSEITSYKESQEGRSSTASTNFSDTVKKEFRTAMSDCSLVLLIPEI